MGWVVLALIATLIDTIVLFIDRYVVQKEQGDVGGLPLVIAAVSLCVGVGFWFAAGFFIPRPTHTGLLLLPGILILWANALYFQAIPKQHQSSIILITFQLHPIFVLVLSWLFLHDTITTRQLLGFSMIVLSVLLLSVEQGRGPNSRRVSPALWLLAASTLSYAVATILLKWATSLYTVHQVAAFQGFGMALGGLTIMVLPGIRAGVVRVIKNKPTRTVVIMSANEVLSQTSKFLRLTAISLGPVALVSAIGSTRVFLGVWVGALLTILAPNIFQEDIRRGSLRTKTFFSLITFAGLLIL